MGIEMEYKDSRGRRHNSLESMLKAEAGLVVDQAASDVERAVRAQRCSIHHRTPSISIRKTGDGFSYTIDGCCDDLVAKAEHAAKAAAS